VRITPFSLPAGLETALEAQGLRRFDDTRVMVLAQWPPAELSLPGGIAISSRRPRSRSRNASACFATRHWRNGRPTPSAC
jgi:hypothetical protein